MAESSPITRERLSSLPLAEAPDRVESYRVVLGPGQRTGEHHHPGGVVGVVTEGVIIFELGGTQRRLEAGDAFVEPPGATVARFDNASADAPATFIAHYLLRANQPLIVKGGS